MASNSTKIYYLDENLRERTKTVSASNGVLNIDTISVSGDIFKIEFGTDVTKIICNIDLYSLNQVYISKTVREIDGFLGSIYLQKVEFDEEINNLTVLGDYLFQGSYILTMIDIPKCITTIGTSTFRDCRSLKQLMFSSGSQLTTIGANAFEDCFNLQYFNTSNITTIGSNAFKNCSTLTSLDISDTVTSIGSNAFVGCTNLNLTFVNRSMSQIRQMPNYPWGLNENQIVPGIPSTILTITFNAMGGQASETTRNVESGYYIGQLPTATRLGNRFLGWFSASSGGTQITAQTIAYSNATYYAHWEQIYVTITFDAVGGSINGSSTKTISVPQYNQIGADIPTATLYGFKFLGWFTEKTAGTQITQYTTVSANATYYAHWEIVYVTISFDLNYEGAGISETRKIQQGLAIGALPTPSRLLFKFDGWFTASSGGSAIASSTLANANATYYAHWTEITTIYTITYNPGEYSSGGERTRTKRYNESITLIDDATVYARLGAIIAGWSTDPAGKIKSYSLGGTYSANADITLYPYWNWSKYVVTFDSVGGEGGTSSIEATYNSQMPNIQVPAIDGYKFNGYYDSNGNQYYNSEGISLKKYDVDGPLTLYAKWNIDKDLFAIPLYSYNDVMLSVIKNLNSRILNQSFTKLVKNDIGIFPINNYIPNVWENKWFVDDTIAGYQKGDVVWKGSMTFNYFLYNYASLIQDYAMETQQMNSYFKYPPESYSYEIERYQNAVSGYSVKTGNKVDGKDEYKQVLPMMFDPGNLTQIQGNVTNTVISIYISMKDDNKAFLSDTASWKPIALKSTESYKEYISSEISIMFDEHVKDYHLDGSTTEEDFDAALMKKDFSNFDVNELYGAPQMRNHNAYMNAQGVDFVLKFAKVPQEWSLSSKYTLYKWFRLWNSGYLEHGGYIEFPSIDEVSSNHASAYTATVELEWSYGSISSFAYDYPTVADNLYGDMHKILYFRDGVEQVIEHGRVLGRDKRYSVSLTPVDFISSYIRQDDDLSGKYDDISYIAKEDYLSSPQIDNDINFPYINTEIHLIKNSSFNVTRSLIDNGELSNRHVSLLQYYVSGYRSSLTRSYDLKNCSVIGLKTIYSYQNGAAVCPEPIVKSNDGVTLENGVDYYIEYENNFQCGSGAKLKLIGYDPWRGSILCSFTICKPLFDGNIVGLSSTYEYGQR